MALPIKHPHGALRLALALAVPFAPPLFAAEPGQGTPTEEAPVAAPPPATDSSLLPDVVVTALPIKQALDKIIAPVSVLSGAALDAARAATIGETVAGEIGVQTTSFGAGAGRPVIRGLDGPRVGVLSNGLGSGDVSTLSQDHAVAIEPFLADQIEILKGPATLLYGSGAIGGVVNIVDGRIPRRLPDNGLSGRAELRGNTVADERTGMLRIDAGAGNLAFHLDGAWRDAGDYATPDGTLANSFVESASAAIGASYIGESGFIGFAVTRFLSDYGNPAEPGDDGEAGVTLDLAQTRHDLEAELRQPFAGFAALRVRLGHIDYRHTEFEGDEVGTIFRNSGNEGRVELVHEPVGRWEGAFGLQFLDRTFKAIGDEAFIPGTSTRGHGLFAIEQTSFGRLDLELGARLERQSSDPVDGATRAFTPLSVSLGGSFRVSDQWHLSMNLDRAQRAPAEEELFSNGPHVATHAYEIGDRGLVEETANQAEIGLHFHSGHLEAKLAAYANRFDDHIHLVDTGEFEDDLAVRRWMQADARFRGFEAEVKASVTDTHGGRHVVRAWGDRVNARLRDGANLPRIAPARAGLGYIWNRNAWRAGIGIVHHFRQDRVAEFETGTAAFTLVDADVVHAFGGSDRFAWEVFAQARNLGNETARLATSYIKDVAPLPGRSFTLGVRAFF